MSSSSKAALYFRLAMVLLPVSITFYALSLTMDVATVVASVDLDQKGISSMVADKVGANVPVDRIAGEINGVVQEMVKEKFSMFANPGTLKMIEDTIRAKVAARGPALIGSMVPEFEIPQPEPQISPIKLLSTIRDLYFKSGDTFLATCILLFTIFFPITKYMALLWIMVMKRATNRKRLLSWLKTWGQWSMGDVFVAAFLVVMLKINTSVVSTTTLATIRVHVDIETGMYLFGGSVIFAMIVSMLLTWWHDAGVDVAPATAPATPTPTAAPSGGSAPTTGTPPWKKARRAKHGRRG
jgi:hypothetical protein